MSVGGFLSQALLGGAAEVGTGIGNKIREDARLKRQQALEQTRTDNTMQVQLHQSALDTGRDNLQREHASAESERGREHDIAMRNLDHENDKDLVNYNLSAKLELARKEAEQTGSLSDWQNANLDRINSDISHLHQMERELTSGRTGEFGEIGLVTPDNSGQKLTEIRQRLKAKEIAFNRVLGNSRGVDSGLAVLTEAARITDPQDRNEFLSDLQQSPIYNEALANDIRSVWDINTAPPNHQPQPGREEEPVSQPTPTMAPDPQQQPPEAAPQGLLSQAAPPQQSPDAGQEPSATQSGDWRERKLGPMLEAGAAAVGEAVGQRAEQNVEKSAGELSQIARGERDPYQGNIRQFLTNNPEALKRLSPEDLELLRQRYGANFINQFLQS